MHGVSEVTLTSTTLDGAAWPRLQAGIEKFMARITQLQGEKDEAEEKLHRANAVINYLQVWHIWQCDRSNAYRHIHQLK